MDFDAACAVTVFVCFWFDQPCRGRRSLVVILSPRDRYIDHCRYLV